MTSRTASVALDRVTRSFRTGAEVVEAVREVTLELFPGEFLALVGPSGCGKSTLLNLIAGLDLPSGGGVTVVGQRVEELSSDDRARLRLEHVGTVFQEHNLVPEFTAVENVMLPLELRGLSADGARAEAEVALDAVGLGGLAARYPNELSGGQRQRVGIARALSGNRSVILADEATGALDHRTSAEIFATLRQIAHAGATVLAVTHDPLGAEFADRTLVMSDGRLETAASRAGYFA